MTADAKRAPRGNVARKLRALSRDPLNILAAVLISVLLVFAVMPGVIAPARPDAVDPVHRLQPPSTRHLFGTDQLGRDLFSRVVFGVRISLGAATAVVVAAAAFGTLVGLLAGYYRGLLGEAVMRVADILVAFPQLVMAMAIVALFGAGLLNAMIAITIIWWPQYARLVRGQVLVTLQEEFIVAARALGVPQWRIQLLHVLPNCLGPVIVRASLDVGTALLLTASLSFLGLGAAPPTPELGALVNEGRDFLMTSWWYATFPGLFILISVLALNMVGDAIDDAFNPRT